MDGNERHYLERFRQFAHLSLSTQLQRSVGQPTGAPRISDAWRPALGTQLVSDRLAQISFNVLSYEAAHGISGLPPHCLDLTAEDVLATQIVLWDGLSDLTAYERMKREGERRARNLDGETREKLAQARHGPASVPSAMSLSRTGKEELTPPCSIWLEEMLGDTKDAAAMLCCQHIPHRLCLSEWVRLGHYLCPLCRKALIAT